jgi:glycosyl transferase family 25
MSDTGILYLCINLARSIDRRCHIEEQASRLALPITFVDAVDGAALTAADRIPYNRNRRLKSFEDLRPNEIACTLSHNKALRVFLESRASYAVILEDDAAVSPDLELVVTAIAAARLVWDAVNLENRRNYPGWRLLSLPAGFGLEVAPHVSRGSAAYMWSRAGATRIIATLSDFWHAYDTHIGFFWRHRLRVLSVTPSLVTTLDGPSTINRAASAGGFNIARHARWRYERWEHEIRKHIYAYGIYRTMRQEMSDG